MPSWSTGCYACRKMKVKCDGQKPDCQRCQGAGRVCPGYRDMSNVIFHSMNDTVSRRSRRRASRLKKPAIACPVKVTYKRLPAADGPSSIENCRTGRSTRHDGLCIQRVIIDWDQQAKCAFFHDYVSQGMVDGPGGYLDFLVDLYREQPNTPYFVEAVAAVSMANFANRASMSCLVLRARRSYGRTLLLINQALSDSVEAQSDCLLTSLVLLGKYEEISGETGTAFENHSRGQMEILRLRGQEQFRTSRGRSLYRLIRSRQRLHDLAFGRGLSGILNVAFESFGPGVHAAKLAELLSRATELCNIIPDVLGLGEQHQQWALSAVNLLQEMNTWNDISLKARLGWLLSTQAPIDGSDSCTNVQRANPHHPKSIFLFKSIEIAAGWSIYWCGRIRLLQAMLKRRKNLSSVEGKWTLLPSKNHICESLLESVDSICAAVPFLLGEVDTRGALSTGSRRKSLGAYYLIWSLYIAGSVECLPPAQALRISDHLLYIGNVFGIKRALVLRERWKASNLPRQDEARISEYRC